LSPKPFLLLIEDNYSSKNFDIPDFDSDNFAENDWLLSPISFLLLIEDNYSSKDFDIPDFEEVVLKSEQLMLSIQNSIEFIRKIKEEKGYMSWLKRLFWERNVLIPF